MLQAQHRLFGLPWGYISFLCLGELPLGTSWELLPSISISQARNGDWTAGKQPGTLQEGCGRFSGVKARVSQHGGYSPRETPTCSWRRRNGKGRWVQLLLGWCMARGLLQQDGTCELAGQKQAGAETRRLPWDTVHPCQAVSARAHVSPRPGTW